MALSIHSKVSILALSVCLSICFAMANDFSIVGYSPEHLTSIGKLIELFESWVSKHGKTYRNLEEKLQRFEIFQDNLNHIDETNKKITDYWLGLNEFADLSHEEFKSKYLGLKTEFPIKRRSPEDFSYRDVIDLPKSVDWRKKGAVTPVKNQGSCGTYHNSVHVFVFSVDGCIRCTTITNICRELLGVFNRCGCGGDKPDCHRKSDFLVRTRTDRLRHIIQQWVQWRFNGLCISIHSLKRWASQGRRLPIPYGGRHL